MNVVTVSIGQEDYISPRMEKGVHARLRPSIGDAPRERHWCQLLLQHDPYNFCSRRGQVETGKLSMAPSPLHLGQGLRQGLADGFRFG